MAQSLEDLLYGVHEGDGEDERPEVPVLGPFLQLITAIEGRLGKDEHGCPLNTEFDSFCVRHRLRDRTEKLIIEDLVWTLSLEVRLVNSERMEDMQDEIRGGNGGRDLEDED